MDDRQAITAPKTKAGIRVLPITLHLRKPLVALRAECDGDPAAFVFGEPSGKPFAHTSITRRARKTWLAASLDPSPSTRPDTPASRSGRKQSRAHGATADLAVHRRGDLEVVEQVELAIRRDVEKSRSRSREKPGHHGDFRSRPPGHFHQDFHQRPQILVFAGTL
jgi:hypothetical protein